MFWSFPLQPSVQAETQFSPICWIARKGRVWSCGLGVWCNHISRLSVASLMIFWLLKSDLIMWASFGKKITMINTLKSYMRIKEAICKGLLVGHSSSSPLCFLKYTIGVICFVHLEAPIDLAGDRLWFLLVNWLCRSLLILRTISSS